MRGSSRNPHRNRPKEMKDKVYITLALVALLLIYINLKPGPPEQESFDSVIEEFSPMYPAGKASVHLADLSLSYANLTAETSSASASPNIVVYIRALKGLVRVVYFSSLHTCLPLTEIIIG